MAGRVMHRETDQINHARIDSRRGYCFDPTWHLCGGVYFDRVTLACEHADWDFDLDSHCRARVCRCGAGIYSGGGQKMTQKRFVKLMMAKGKPRNDALRMALSASSDFSYAQAFEIECCLLDVARLSVALQKISCLVNGIGKAFVQFEKAVSSLKTSEKTEDGSEPS